MLKTLACLFNISSKAGRVGQSWVICPYNSQMTQTSETSSITLIVFCFFVIKSLPFLVNGISRAVISSVSPNLIRPILF